LHWLQGLLGAAAAAAAAALRVVVVSFNLLADAAPSSPCVGND